MNIFLRELQIISRIAQHEKNYNRRRLNWTRLSFIFVSPICRGSESRVVNLARCISRIIDNTLGAAYPYDKYQSLKILFNETL